MDLRQLEYLVAVVEESNFTRAAERVHVSQSGVSAQIRQLERELGVTLLDRSERRVRPTAAGAAILPAVRATLAGSAGVRQVADELAGLVRGRVSVGMVTGCTVATLFDALADFHDRYPDVELSLREEASDALADGVRTGRFDLALLGTSGTLPAGVVSDVISQERLMAAVPTGHALAAAGTITLQQLVGNPLICLPPGSGVRTALETACAAAGLTADIRWEASAPVIVAGLAERGLGVAVLTETMTAAHPTGLIALPVDDPPLSSRLELAWRDGASTGPAAREAISTTRAAFAHRRGQPAG